MSSWVNAFHRLLTAPFLMLPYNITLVRGSDGGTTIRIADLEIMLQIDMMNPDKE